MDGIGFVLPLWIGRARRSGLFPTLRSHLLFSVLAEAADVDGRWCYLYQSTVAARSGGLLSGSTVLRALGDLKAARLVRVLGREETRAFFAADLVSGARHADRLPLVIDLLVPAEAYPAQVLAEINHVRARLGEDLLVEATRPYPAVGTTRQPDTGEASTRRTDLSPKDPSHHRVGTSVRERVTTGGEEATRTTAHPDISESSTASAPLPRWPARLAAAVPAHRLTRPDHDRRALADAAGSLLDQGLSEHDVRALFTGTDALDRPFPALMRRLRTIRDARAFLAGHLGRTPGTDPATGSGTDPLAPDPFAHRPRFEVDHHGTAARTCPHHPSVRNTPGGACRVCGGPLPYRPRGTPARVRPGQYRPGSVGTGPGLLRARRPTTAGGSRRARAPTRPPAHHRPAPATAHRLVRAVSRRAVGAGPVGRPPVSGPCRTGAEVVTDEVPWRRAARTTSRCPRSPR
jgi:hypothetical protein